MLKQLLPNIPDEAKRSFRYHIIYSIIDGFILGLFALNEFILIKSLKGTNYQIAFLFQAMIIVLLFSVVLNEILNRARSKKKLIRTVAIAARKGIKKACNEQASNYFSKHSFILPRFDLW